MEWMQSIDDKKVAAEEIETDIPKYIQWCSVKLRQ